MKEIDGKMGYKLFVKYKKKGEKMLKEKDEEMKEEYIIVRGMMNGEMYELSVVEVDGEIMKESEIEEVEI